MKQHNVMLIRTPYVRALALAAGLAASTMTSIDVSIRRRRSPMRPRRRQQPMRRSRREMRSDIKAPIGHRQPRPQDLPASVGRDEDRIAAAEREFDKKLEMKASERRPPFGAVVDPRGSVALN